MKRNKNLHPLSWDHHAILTSVVFTRKQIKAGVDRDRLAQIAHEFGLFYDQVLTKHFRHEEEWLLPRYLRHVPHDDTRVIRLLTEHVLLHKLVLDLAQALTLSGDLIILLTALTDRLESHVRFEERELFPAIESTLTSSELEELGAQLVASTHETIVIPGGDGCRVKISASMEGDSF